MTFNIFGGEVPPWVFALATGAYLLFEIGRTWLALRSELWPWVEGWVHEVSIEEGEDEDGEAVFTPKVLYTYLVAGEKFEGTQFWFQPNPTQNYLGLRDAMRGVRAGAAHRVYFDPRFPSVSVLNPGAARMQYLLVALLFAFLLFSMAAQVRKG